MEKSKSGREIALSLTPSKDGGWKKTAQEQKVPSSNERNIQRNSPVWERFEDQQQSPVVDQAETRTEAEERDNELHSLEVSEEPV